MASWSDCVMPGPAEGADERATDQIKRWPHFRFVVFAVVIVFRSWIGSAVSGSARKVDELKGRGGGTMQVAKTAWQNRQICGIVLKRWTPFFHKLVMGVVVETLPKISHNCSPGLRSGDCKDTYLTWLSSSSSHSVSLVPCRRGRGHLGTDHAHQDSLWLVKCISPCLFNRVYLNKRSRLHHVTTFTFKGKRYLRRTRAHGRLRLASAAVIGRGESSPVGSV